MKTQKLYDVPRDSWIVVVDEVNRVPVAAPEIKENEILYFHHVDGMYSLCQDNEGNIKHLSAMANVVDITELVKKRVGKPNVIPGEFR